MELKKCINKAGIPAKVVQAMLGHKDITLTLNTYTHLLKETLHTEMDKMNDVFAVGASKAAAKNRDNSKSKSSANIKKKGEPDQVR